MTQTPPTDFDRWLGEEFARGSAAGLTCLAILLRIGENDVEPLCSTHMHVVGRVVGWGEISTHFAGAGVAWDAAVFYPHRDAATGGPLEDAVASRLLLEQQAQVLDDRLAINAGHFFNAAGSRVMVEAAP